MRPVFHPVTSPQAQTFTYGVKNNLQLQSDRPLRQPAQVLFLQREGDLLSPADLRDRKGIRCRAKP